MKKVKLGKLVTILIVVVILLYLMVAAFLKENLSDSMVLQSYAINGILLTALLIRSIMKHPYSIESMQWLFFFFFLFLAALVQYIFDGFRYAYVIDNSKIIIANFYILLWILMFEVGAYFSKIKIRLGHHGTGLKKEQIHTKDKKMLFVFLFINLAITIYIIKIGGLSSILSRYISIMVFSKMSQTSGTLIKMIAKTSITFFFAIVCLRHRKYKDCISFLVISFIYLIIVYFPTGMARFHAATIYLGIFLLMSKKVKMNNFFIILFLGGFFILYPLLSIYRKYSFNEINIVQFLTSYFSNDLLTNYVSSEYDAYSTFLYCIDYVKNVGISYGNQLIGVFLFFIPRVFWPGKPIGSGDMIMNYHGNGYTNVSMTLVGEGLINFGIAGILIFAFLTGYLVRNLDNQYWKQLDMNAKDVNSFLEFIYPFLIPLSFFICRGDLLSTGSYTMGYVSIGYVYYTIFLKAKDKKTMEKYIWNEGQKP